MYRKIARIMLCLLALPYLLSVPYQFIRPPSTLMLYDLSQFRLPARDWVRISEMSPQLIRAVITAEDSAFCDHFGIDFRQLSRSIDEARRENKPVKATSTITQQLAKNLFLWHGRSWLRKGLEVPLTFWLELTWSKRNILEAYLNVVEWGDGVYGAQAAAAYYFGTNAANLSAVQSAMLATTLPNPKERSASRPGPAQLLMSGQLLSRMTRAAPDLSCIR